MRYLPSELVNNGIDMYLEKSAVKFHGIYWLFVTFVVIVCTVLPFVYVDVSVQNAGMIRPVTEKTEIRSSVSELVDSVYVHEGQKVIRGDTILTFIRSSLISKSTIKAKDSKIFASICPICGFYLPVRNRYPSILLPGSRNIISIYGKRPNMRQILKKQKRILNATNAFLMEKSFRQKNLKVIITNITKQETLSNRSSIIKRQNGKAI
jgi:multidrug efflux pump subunit AcrA (membrane-fusion protein)